MMMVVSVPVGRVRHSPKALAKAHPLNYTVQFKITSPASLASAHGYAAIGSGEMTAWH